MFHALKRLFKREETPAPATSAPPDALSSTPQNPASPISPDSLPEAEIAPAEEPAAPPPQPVAPQPAAGPDKVVRLPLKSILATLPANLKGRVRQTGIAGIHVPLALDDITPQLACGHVKIPWGTLRALVPPGVISDSADQDETPIDLPLSDILSRVPPQLLHRRHAQKTIAVPDEVAPVFNKRGATQHIRVLTNEKPKAAPQPSKITPPYRSTNAPRPPAAAPSQPIASSAPAPGLAAAAQTAAPIAMSRGDLELLAKARASAKPAPAVQPITPPPAPITGPKATSAPLPGTTRPPASAPAAAAAPNIPPASPEPAALPKVTPAAKPKIPVTPPAVPGSVSIPVAKVIDAFPDVIQSTLGEAKTRDAVFALPAGDLEKGLKSGKVAFPWRTLRSSLRPAIITSTTPAADSLIVELPLDVVAPIFLASHRAASPQRKMVIAQDIPDVFTPARGNVAGEAATPPAAPAKQPVPVGPATSPAGPLPPATEAAPSAPSPSPTPAPPASAPSTVPDTPAAPAIPIPVPAIPPPAVVTPAAADIGELFGQPGRKNWTPAEIVQKTSQLDGVGGALVVLPDGLLVAAQLPPGLDGETISAFLPQMFSRMTQYCKALRFGDPRKMTFIIDELPMKIYRGAGVYFTVLGRAGEPLPNGHLDVIAAQLGSPNK